MADVKAVLLTSSAGTWTDIGKKLAQPNLDESFDIESDEDVSSDDENSDDDFGTISAEKWNSLAEVASSQGDLNRLKALIQACPHRVNDRIYKDGWTVLLNSASAGHNEMCVWLLQQKDIEINKQNLSGTAPLLAAASHGHCRVVSALLDAKANCDHKLASSIYTDAAMNGHPEVMQLCLDHGIDLSRPTLCDALRAAQHTDRVDSVEFLLKQALRWPRKDFKNLLTISKGFCKKKTKVLFEQAEKDYWLLSSCRRAWCRVLWTPDFHPSTPPPALATSFVATEAFLEWFRDFPGLRRQVGGIIVTYYRPSIADWLCPPTEESADDGHVDDEAADGDTNTTFVSQVDEAFSCSGSEESLEEDSSSLPPCVPEDDGHPTTDAIASNAPEDAGAGCDVNVAGLTIQFDEEFDVDSPREISTPVCEAVAATDADGVAHERDGQVDPSAS